MTRTRDVATQGGLVLLNTTTFSAVTTVSIDNCFSSAYNNYKIIINTTSGTGGTGGNITWQSRNAGTTDTSSVYSYVGILNVSTSSTATSEISQSSGFLGRAAIDSNAWAQCSLEVFAPFLAQYTGIISANMGVSGGADAYANVQSRRRTATSHDGISFTFGNSSIGTIRVYGYK